MPLLELKPNKKGAEVAEKRNLLFGLALLLTVISGVTPQDHYGGLSTIITTPNDPSALQQLASFSALQHVAEEENLDWGAAGSLAPGATKQPNRPAGVFSPSSSSSELGGVSDTSSGHSGQIRQAHRRQHRHKGSSNGGSSCSPSSDGCSVVEVEQPSVRRHQMWSQLHVMEVAYSTNSNNFIHITERFVAYQHMYPTVYQCNLAKAPCEYEAALMAHPNEGLPESRVWSCGKCGNRHQVVRERCTRCRTPSHFVKLFVGQTMKEVDCTSSLVRFIHAALPEVKLHRVQCHKNENDRGRGCASIYVYPEAAEKIISNMNGNAFFDMNDVTGDVFVHYVYPEQQMWLNELVRARTAHPGRPAHMPWKALVVERSVSEDCNNKQRRMTAKCGRTNLVHVMAT